MVWKRLLTAKRVRNYSPTHKGPLKSRNWSKNDKGKHIYCRVNPIHLLFQNVLSYTYSPIIGWM